MINAAVCDDNNVHLRYLGRIVSELLDDLSTAHTVDLFSSGDAFLESHRQFAFDAVFLDIKMPEPDGFEVAKQIRSVSEKTYIIFITTESGLVYDSFDFRPFHFIPKSNPEILKIKLRHVIEKLIEHMDGNRPICLELPYNEKKYMDPALILYISSKSNYLDVVTERETIHLRGKIEDMLNRLPAKNFVRIHNRYILNLKHLCRIDHTRLKVLLDNSRELDVSRAYKALLVERNNIFLRDFS